jgi:hypothetical protein
LVAVDLSPQTTGETLFIFMQPIYCFCMGAWRNGGCSASYDSFVVGSSAVLRFNFCAKNPPLRQVANRYASLLEDRTNIIIWTKIERQIANRSQNKRAASQNTSQRFAAHLILPKGTTTLRTLRTKT